MKKETGKGKPPFAFISILSTEVDTESTLSYING